MRVRGRAVMMCALLMSGAVSCARELPAPSTTVDAQAVARSEAAPAPPGDRGASYDMPAAAAAVPEAQRAQEDEAALGLSSPARPAAQAQEKKKSAYAREMPASGAGYARRAGPEGRVAASPAASVVQAIVPAQEHNTEAYASVRENDFVRVADAPLSTFSADVDTASYSNVRRFLSDGQLPPPDAVRVEELVNYFRYAYPEPAAAAPFATYTEVGPCPWNPAARLVHIGLRAKDVRESAVPPRNLVFLVDVSGSMQDENKLPLLKRGLGMLAERLRPQDHVAIVVYAGSSGVALAPTSDRAEVMAALQRLEAGGSTNGAEGIELAYRVAASHFDPRGINRVILATDGDFNVGVTSEGALSRLIEDKRKTGVYLTVLGFGSGNLQDARMEQLADKGNGNYAYIDTLAEAQKVLVREAGSTLVTVAKDVKLQIEWNPAQVASYRLVGYENRALQARDFNDDTKDAGELGAGHTVTALYEVLPRGAAAPSSEVDPLRYQRERAPSDEAASNELLTLKVRYKLPQSERSELYTRVLSADPDAREASASFRFSAAVAGFAQLLRHSPHVRGLSVSRVRELAASGAGADAHGDRAEFVELLKTAERRGLGS
jgi:Ca-activated chloride channel family protein